MNAAQISRARAVAEESEDGQLIRDLCDALESIREMHQEDLFRGHLSNGCKTCGWDDDNGYPCRTMQALGLAA